MSSHTPVAASGTATAAAAPSAGVPVAAAAAAAPRGPNSESESSQSASLGGAIGRAAAVVGTSAMRMIGTLYRVPLKTFRQNKFDVTAGHQQLHPLPTATAVAADSRRQPAAKRIRLLMEQQGRATVIAKQVAPSIVANVLVGATMFQTFDRSMAAMSAAARAGQLPSWVCSNTLSTQSTERLSPASACDHAAFLTPYTGPDVFVSGFLSGAAQTAIVAPLENSATWIRIKYAVLQQEAHAADIAAAVRNTAAASAASSPARAAAAVSTPAAAASTAVLEATATNLIPPAPPRDVHTLNIYSSVKEMVLARSLSAPRTHVPVGSSSTTAAAAAAASFHGHSPPVALFSHCTFRAARDSIGLGFFFFSFEFLYARLHVVPYLWLDQHDTATHTRPSAHPAASTATSPSVSPQVLIATAPDETSLGSSFYLLPSLVAWECASVLLSGVIAGSAYHVATYPFYKALQHIEAAHLLHAADETRIGCQRPRPLMSAWSELVRLRRDGGFSSLFSGVFGGSTGDAAMRRPRLINPMVIGLLAYTLSKQDHHTHQLATWRAQRRRERAERAATTNK